MYSNDQKIIIFSAPSGSGKTTLTKYCLQTFPELKFSISATTRKPRGTEENGKEYYFLSEEDFKEKISENRFVEYEEVYNGTYYGTLKSEMERIWNEGKVVIFDVDVKGGMNLKKIFGDSALSIFIAPPSIQELENRLRNRNTDDDESIKTRIAKAQEELSYMDKFDKIVINEDLSVSKAKIVHLIRQFLHQN